MDIYNNYGIFFDLVKKIRAGYSDTDILIEFGGGNMYIPSFKKKFRNLEIIRDKNKGIPYEILAKKYQLSSRRIQSIITIYRKSEMC